MHTFENQAVQAVFDSFPAEVRGKLLKLRKLTFHTAAGSKGVGVIEETLK